MREAARVSAAIDLLSQFNAGESPARNMLAAWARTNRYAGSKDRRAISDMLFDALRRRSSYASCMDSDQPRAIILAVLVDAWGLSIDEIDALCDGEKFSPLSLTELEKEGLALLLAGRKEGNGGESRGELADNGAADVEADLAATSHIPAWRLADVPEWVYPMLEAAFGERTPEECRALSLRAPIDLRANHLKIKRNRLLEELAEWKPQPIDGLPDGVRIKQPGLGQRVPQLEKLPLFEKGAFELQDKGSQLAAMLTGAAPGKQVLDLCAGAGGKTLAMAALMKNSGQIHAYDIDARRMKPLSQRARRAGVRNLHVLKGGDAAALAELDGKMHVVLVDAPCTGSGTWRRKPDSKWRLTQKQLAARLAEQDEVLEQGAKAVRPHGGRLVYVTCSLLPQENAERVAAFLAAHADFQLVPTSKLWAEGGNVDPAPRTALASSGSDADNSDSLLQLTPARHQTDAFFIAVMERG